MYFIPAISELQYDVELQIITKYAANSLTHIIYKILF